MTPEEWHRRLCVVTGHLAWMLERRQLKRSLLVTFVATLRAVADDIEKVVERKDA
jgi:hypothetical protein